MTLPTTTIDFTDLTSNPRFAKFSAIAENALSVWKEEGIKPRLFSIGVSLREDEASDEPRVYKLDTYNNKPRDDGQPECGLCLIGAAMLGKPVGRPGWFSVTRQATEVYNLSDEEISDIILGFDHGSERYRSSRACVSDDALAFGAAVRTAIFGPSGPDPAEYDARL